MVATGFSNSWTSGEISEDAWDRVDIQPEVKGCKEATNYIPRVAGPLGKRRGFWRLGALADQSKPGRMVPFRRSIDDALMLEFGDLTVRVWNNDGAPYLDDDGDQVQFASAYTTAQLDGLRFKQVGDVLYLRHRDGLQPRTLTRASNTSWIFLTESFPNGPWLGENVNTAFGVTVTGTQETDANPDTTAITGSILVGHTVTLVADDDLFDAAQIGGYFRLRANDGSPSVRSWSAGMKGRLGAYCLSNGRVYCCTRVATWAHGGSDDDYNDNPVTTPPVVSEGSQSDGGNLWDYRHDGAGIVKITAVTDKRHAAGVVTATLPFLSGTNTSYWAEGAYSNYRGWPRMWPGIREERLVEGAPSSRLDFLDLTESAGFTTDHESFKPGLGTGQVVSTDAVRRRLGDDGAELLWAHVVNFLIVGSASGEYLVAGGALDEAISPSSVVVKSLSGFGSADVYPAKAHKGVIYVLRGGQTLRELTIDAQQNDATDDLTVLAAHIGARKFTQLAWVPQPDEVLWTRLGDGGFAAFTYHQEQEVRGFTRQSLPGGFTVEDMAVLPGPERQETLWMIVHRVKDAADQRFLLMQATADDALFMDVAEYYAGAPVTTVAGLGHFEGETVRVLADGVQLTDRVVASGAIHLSAAASVVQVGLARNCRFKSLSLDIQGLGGTLGLRQRVTACIVSMKTALARVGLDGGLMQTVSTRGAGDTPGTSAKRTKTEVACGGDSGRDPRIVIEDDTAYDGVIFSLKPKVDVGG